MARTYRVIADVITPRVSGRNQTPAETGKWCTYDTVGILYASRSLAFDDTAVSPQHLVSVTVILERLLV